VSAAEHRVISPDGKLRARRLADSVLGLAFGGGGYAAIVTR
jgi:hypothetical protein